MKTVTLQVASTESVKARTRDAFRGHKQGSRISFATPELLFRLLTAKRWQLIRALTGASPVTIREVARRVNRDVKAVHGDVHARSVPASCERPLRGVSSFRSMRCASM